MYAMTYVHRLDREDNAQTVEMGHKRKNGIVCSLSSCWRRDVEAIVRDQLLFVAAFA